MGISSVSGCIINRMSSTPQKSRNWRQRIRDHYRLVVLNDETLQEVSRYRLNLLNLYILSSTLFVLIGALVFVFIIYTPIKKVIPGYGDITATPEFIQLKEQTKTLEQEIVSLQTYIEANKNRILGNPNASTSNNSQLMNQAYKPEQLDRVDTITYNKEGTTPIVKKEMKFFYPPLQGRVSAEYNDSGDHFGIDILAPKNTPISTIADGTVISAEFNLETGNTISVQHGNDVISLYKHNAELLKGVGDHVKSGEPIAIIGNTGTKTNGAHLHFELWMNGQSVDPRVYIDFSE